MRNLGRSQGTSAPKPGNLIAAFATEPRFEAASLIEVGKNDRGSTAKVVIRTVLLGPTESKAGAWWQCGRSLQPSEHKVLTVFSASSSPCFQRISLYFHANSLRDGKLFGKLDTHQLRPAPDGVLVFQRVDARHSLHRG